MFDLDQCLMWIIAWWRIMAMSEAVSAKKPKAIASGSMCLYFQLAINS